MKGQTKQTDEALKVVKLTDVPAIKARGREAFITSLPFWAKLVEELKDLGAGQAAEINLDVVAKQAGPMKLGVKLDPPSLVSRIQYQFEKQGLDKKYSLRFPKKGTRAWVLDHQSASQLAA